MDFNTATRRLVLDGINNYKLGDDISSFNFTRSAILIATISGSLSCVSSLLIIVVIVRSKKWSPYHRIMLIYSIFDFMLSFAIALTTIPMPPEDAAIYDFGGSSYGNRFTCSLQSYTILFSLFGLMASASILYTYYCCAIVFKMPLDQFARRVERPLYLVSFISATIYSLVFLIGYPDMMNPSPIAPWCSWDSFPHGCIEDGENIAEDEFVCHRGRSSDQNVLVLLMIPPLVISFIVLITTMSSILYTYSKNLKTLCKARDEMKLNGEEEVLQESIEEAKITSRKVTMQAIAYILSFLLTWIFLLLRFGIRDSDALEILRLVFQPSQGVFHVVIFLWQKIDIARTTYSDSNLSVYEAFIRIITNPNEIEEKPISNLNNKIFEIEHYRRDSINGIDKALENMIVENFEDDSQREQSTNKFSINDQNSQGLSYFGTSNFSEGISFAATSTQTPTSGERTNKEHSNFGLSIAGDTLDSN
ncbi:hypothetical protein CTEN210_12540 [Chaetoceros tenuissimus]|uniref:G-protein coupled receptors family 1 profile domain-containing protein n=1 Tax=Chaetoceros tenuissimus TaxID=426638 RepID=A0AAD3D1M4_9STRA|nr:hypothetical protein CTEN210_12540 [Chaetoceros tenuissimus]